MSWLFLILAGLCEVGFVISLGKARYSTGSISILWYAAFAFFLGLSMFLLIKATEVVPLGTAYAVWTGIGAAGSVLVGVLVFKEPAGLWRIVFLSTLILSIVGLKIASPDK